ncbi:MAG: GNAT family N-acetyltransferase [Chlorobi bacterium]|nr:GNAT family N-acetyltransferase [Chlorobiota bacterium]
MSKSWKDNTLKVHIRDYKKHDYEEVIALWIPLDLGRPERGDDDRVIEQTVNHDGKLLIMELEETGEIIGTSWLTNDQRRLYLHHFGIKKEYQGRGLSKILLEKSLEVAKQIGLQIKLEVHKTNTVAVNLYKKYAFKYLGDYDVYIIREFE